MQSGFSIPVVPALDLEEERLYALPSLAPPCAACNPPHPHPSTSSALPRACLLDC